MVESAVVEVGRAGGEGGMGAVRERVAGLRGEPYGRPVCDTDSPCFTHAKHARNMRETCETPCVTCAKHVRNMREMSRNVCETCETADAMHAKHPRNMCEMCETAGAKCGNGRYCKYTKPKVWKSSHAKGS